MIMLGQGEVLGPGLKFRSWLVSEINPHRAIVAGASVIQPDTYLKWMKMCFILNILADLSEKEEYSLWQWF